MRHSDESLTRSQVDGEILGQGRFKYRAVQFWGYPSDAQYPVNDCHGIAEDVEGRIVLLTNDVRNNLIAYRKDGTVTRAWESRFPGAHGLEITQQSGSSQYWITDHDRQVVSMCTPEGRELRCLTREDVGSALPDGADYQPTNVSVMPEGDFFVADGYGTSLIHHFDPDWRYMDSFGGRGDEAEKFNCPHGMWTDTRSDIPQLLVCDRGHNMLKWFSTSGELIRVVELPSLGFERIGGLMPANVAGFQGELADHLAVACLSGTILILDGADQIVSILGGPPAVYVDGRLQAIRPFNHTFSHPHDICIDGAGAVYVAQWWASHTYPIKLEPIESAT